jgi:hypothetical protein
MDQTTFLFQLGLEAAAQPARWTLGKVWLEASKFELEAELLRSGDRDFYSSHHAAFKFEEPFSPELFIGILQIIGDAGFKPSIEKLTVAAGSEFSDDWIPQIFEALAIWDLALDCRSSVPSRITECLRKKLKRISMLERIGAASSAIRSG